MAIPDISALNADGLDETFLRQCIEENDISGIAYAANMYNFDMNFLPDTPDTSDAPETPLCLACKLGFLEAAKELVSWGARLESYTDEEPSPLIWAAKNGHIEVVKWLVEQGVDVNDYYEMTDNYGDIEWGATALTEALANGYIDIASILNYGASPFINGYREEINIADIQKKFWRLLWNY
mgnify:FL=1